jgi:HAD superfamily hydrolase (TIGR01509 family)
MTIQAVFFDMGGTIDTFGFTREYRILNVHYIKDCLASARISLNLSDEQLADSITEGASEYLRWNMNSYIELSPAEIWSKFFLKGQSISVHELSPIAEELAFIYETKLFHREIRKEVPGVLAKIKEMGFQLGLISNTQSLKQVRFNLEQYGILEYFDPIVLSSEYGRRKPDPAIFYHAARLAGVPTGACAYVGDKINRDIVGARRSGFRLAVQIKHKYDDGIKDEGASPDAVIENMQELTPILEAEKSKDRSRNSSIFGNNVKAIFFDAGDILYFRPHKEENLNKFFVDNQIQVDSNYEQERAALKDIAFSGRMGRHKYYEKVLSLYGINDPKLIDEGVKAMSLDDNTVEIFDGVPETINQLKEKGFVLGIITDTALPISKKLNWFDQNGFGGLWDVFISSKEIGVRKPDPAMYEKAIRQVGICPTDAVFVGHKISELDGARAVGMKTIAFNFDEGAIADFYIDQFSDLLNVPFLEK